MRTDKPVVDEDLLDANRDPITGAPGSHPVATGVGALAGGAAAGAVVGTFAGPVGTAVGAAIGAVAGGLAGKDVGEMVDPTAEDAYWRTNYNERPYVKPGTSYEDYGPAYRYGADSWTRHRDRSWDDVESELSDRWPAARSTSRLEWNDAKHAARDAWQRLSDTVERATPGDSDRDGK